MATPYRTVRDEGVTATVTGQVVKIGEGEIAYFVITNGGVVDAYFHIYDALVADVSVGTTVPKASFPVPAGADATHVGICEYNGPPIHFEVGAVYACTTSPLAAGSTTPVVSPNLGTLQYR